MQDVDETKALCEGVIKRKGSLNTGSSYLLQKTKARPRTSYFQVPQRKEAPPSYSLTGTVEREGDWSHSRPSSVIYSPTFDVFYVKSVSTIVVLCSLALLLPVSTPSLRRPQFRRTPHTPLSSPLPKAFYRKTAPSKRQQQQQQQQQHRCQR